MEYDRWSGEAWQCRRRTARAIDTAAQVESPQSEPRMLRTSRANVPLPIVLLIGARLADPCRPFEWGSDVFVGIFG